MRDALKSLIQLTDDTTHIIAAGELYYLFRRLIDEQRYLGINEAAATVHNDAAQMQGYEFFNLPSARTTREQGHNQPSMQANRRLSNASGSLTIYYVSWGRRWKLMFSERMRRANYAAAAVMIAQQLCGINLLAFLADTFFRNSFFDSQKHSDPTIQQNTQLLAFSLGFGILNFISTIPALFYIENSQGRRALLNFSFQTMAASLLISGLVLLVPAKDPVTGRAKDEIIGIHFLFLATFTIAYSIGEGPAAFVISAEVFPLVNRELGMSLAVFWNFLGAGLLAVVAPFLTKRMGQVGILGLFTGTNILAWFICYWLIPDTGKEELEEILNRLNVPTRFAFEYACKSIWETFRRSCLYPLLFWGGKSWKDCGNGKDILTVQEAYAVSQRRGLQNAEEVNEVAP